MSLKNVYLFFSELIFTLIKKVKKKRNFFCGSPRKRELLNITISTTVGDENMPLE